MYLLQDFRAKAGVFSLAQGSPHVMCPQDLALRRLFVNPKFVELVSLKTMLE